MSSRRIVRLGEIAPNGSGYVDFQSGAWIADGQTEAALVDDWKMPVCGRWYSDPERTPSLERQLLSNKTLLAVITVLVALMVLCRFVLQIEPFTLGLFLACFGVPLLATVTIQAVDKSARAFDKARLLVEDPRDPDVCPVVVAIYRDGQVIGEDSGVVMFEDATLTFSGNLCSFVIGRRDIAAEPWRIASRCGLLDHLDDLLFLRTDGPAVALSIKSACFLGELWFPPETSMRFVARLAAFRHGPGGPERSFYPPLTVSPPLLQDPLAFRHLVWLQILAFIYFALLAMLTGLAPAVGIAAAAVCALGVPLLRPRRVRT